MTLSDVRALGKGIMVDVHGHKLSGAAKMTCLVYLTNQALDDLDPTLIERGREFVTKHLSKTS